MLASKIGTERQRREIRAPKARNMKARGQARSASPLGNKLKTPVALKGRNTRDISAFQALSTRGIATRGDALRFASRLPLAFIFRAFGALIPRPWRSIPRPWRSVTTLRQAEASRYQRRTSTNNGQWSMRPTAASRKTATRPTSRSAGGPKM